MNHREAENISDTISDIVLLAGTKCLRGQGIYLAVDLANHISIGRFEYMSVASATADLDYPFYRLDPGRHGPWLRDNLVQRIAQEKYAHLTVMDASRNGRTFLLFTQFPQSSRAEDVRLLQGHPVTVSS